MSGRRRTRSATCPSSFRQGQTTETERSPTAACAGRATIHHVRQRWLKGQRFATPALSSPERSGTRFGMRIRRSSVTCSSPASSRTLRTSCGETQLRIGFAGFSRQPLGQRDHGPPEEAVRADEHACARVRVAGDGFEQPDQVVHVRHEVAEDDVVERLPEVEVLTRACLQLELRMRRARCLDHLRAEVDADSARRLQRREQVAGAAADLEHRRARQDVEPRDSARSAGGTSGCAAASGAPRRRIRRRMPRAAHTCPEPPSSEG